VQELFRIALVDVKVAKAGSAKQAAVGDGAGGQEEWDRDGSAPQRRA